MADLSKIIIGGLIITAVSTAFVDQDRRGLAFFTEPEIFALEESADDVQPAGFPVVWGEPLGSTSNRAANPTSISRKNRKMAEAPIARQNPARALASDRKMQSAGAGNLGPSSLTPTAELNTNPQLTDASVATDASFTPAQPQGVTTLPVPQVVPVIAPIVPGFSSGGTIVVTTEPISPVDPTTPVTPANPIGPIVPAVPEPSSWLMMILGVALLGLMLRYRRDHSVDETKLGPITA